MASRYRSLSKSSLSLFKSAMSKPTVKPNPIPSPLSTRSSLTSSRQFPQLGALQSLLPLHSAVSSARLTSCLGIDSRSSRSMSQELGLSVPR
ncbi:protein NONRESPONDING TO OXYLIPINS 2, mitochondrial isoform X2 [Jatropha curcas]|uniref:protein NONRESPONDING TO OXYLIPINS 2, mitochondrial isoform X2 n=1 Tax=Jatropha curcas TaxID=180498 RepID=UPI0005FC02E2|nr:protein NONRESPONDING TO OXYLIPINS 2, mitochondrial isoform X2 [Jatropha curcas]